MLIPATNLAIYSITALGAVGNENDVYTALRYVGNDYYNVLVEGGRLAYGLLTACTIASTAIIWRDAYVSLVDIIGTNSTSDASGLCKIK